MSLEKKIASSLSLVFIGKGATQILSFLIFVVIARFITPDEFGLAALCYVFMALCQLLFSSISEVIIVLQVEDKERLSSLFWFILLIGILLATGCYLNADSIAHFYDEPRIEELLIAFSIFPVILGLQALPRAILMKEMDFRAFALRSFIAVICGGIVGVYMAYEGYGALSLIMQQNVQFAIAAIIFWWVSKWRPSFYMKVQKVCEVIKPGLKVTALEGVNFVKEQSPRILLGYFLGAASVGFYSFAHRMTTALQEMLTNPVFMVLFPALSKAREQPNAQEKIFTGFFMLISCIVAPAVVLAVMTAPLYVPLIFGEKWAPAIPVLQIVLSASLVMQYGRLPDVLFRVYDKVHVQLIAEIILIIIALILLWFAAQQSTVAVASALLVMAFLYPPVLYHLLSWKVDIHLWSYMTFLVRPAIAVVAMIIAVYLCMKNTDIENKVFELFIILLCGGSTYLLFAAILMRDHVVFITSFVKSLIASKSKVN